MIREFINKETKGIVLLDDKLITFIEKRAAYGVCIHIHGENESLLVGNDFDEIKKIYIEARSRDQFSDMLPQKIINKEFTVVQVKNNKFKVDLRTVQRENEETTSIKITTNFSLVNIELISKIEAVHGVERYVNYQPNKYDGIVMLGNLFDAETVRNEVEMAIKSYLI